MRDGRHRLAALIVGVVGLLWGPVGRPAEGPLRDLYLASRDEIRAVERILGELPAARADTFVGIVGGLAALNFIERLQPADILLVDLNPAQVEYGRCVIELIKRTALRDDLVAALFSRPFVADEATFLAQPGDPARLQASTQAIEDPGLRASCARDLALIAHATFDPATRSLLVRRNTNGKHLQRGGPDKGMPIGFNFLYYGRGWLASDEAYTRTRSALLGARIRFLASDIGAVDPSALRGRDIMFWGSNLATWFREGRQAYERFVIRAHEELFARGQAARLVFASTYRRTAWTDFTPFEPLGAGVHLDASAKVKRHAQGKTVLELIPGKAYFGKELRAKDVVVQSASRPIDAAAAFEVVVLHILNNSGMKWWGADRASAFRAHLDTALARAKEVVILEHNRASQDFSDAERARMVGLGDLLQPLFDVLAKRRLALGLEPAVGKVDNARNLVLHIRKL